jgi:serine/threonine protein kinase
MNGTRLGQYTLIRQLARGGMSEVYLARKEGDERFYALKIAKQEDERHYQRLQREMRALSTLRHPHILPVLDYGEQDGIGYCVTPYIEHGTLKERIAEGPLSVEETEKILTQIADALQFMHDAGLVHRDIKPGNVLLSETGEAWLADFGLAKDLQVRSDLTDGKCLMGTPFYMAPELAEHPASPSSDIYALGVVLYEMLTGRPPFTGKTALQICWRHAYELPQPPSRYNRQLPLALDRVILRALAKNPALRFLKARDLAAAYHRALVSGDSLLGSRIRELASTGNTTVVIPSARSIKAAWPMRQRACHLAVASVMMALLFTAGAFGFALGYQGQQPGFALASAQMLALPGRASHAPHQPTVQPGATPTVPVMKAGTVKPQGNQENPGKPENHGKHGNKGSHGKGHGDD